MPKFYKIKTHRFYKYKGKFSSYVANPPPQIATITIKFVKICSILRVSFVTLLACGTLLCPTLIFQKLNANVNRYLQSS